METTEPQALSEEQAFEALDDTPAEETTVEAEEAPVEEPTETDEDEVETDDVSETEEPEEVAEVEDVEDDEDEAEEAPSHVEFGDDDVFSIPVNGEMQEVTGAELKAGISGQKFIQKGMEENAQARKALQGEYQTLHAARNELAQIVKSVQQTGVIPQPTPPDPARAQTDPIGYMQDRAEFEQQAGAYQQQQAQIQQMERQQEEATSQQKQAFVAEQRAKLVEAIPEFGDPQSAAKTRDAIVQIGEKYGFSREELANVVDSRAIIALHDLLKLEAVNASKRKVKNKVAKARPVVKAGNANASTGKAAKRRDNLKKLRETGSDEFALSLLDE